MADFIISRTVFPLKLFDCSEDPLFYSNFELQKFSGKPEVAKLFFFLLKIAKSCLNYYLGDRLLFESGWPLTLIRSSTFLL